MVAEAGSARIFGARATMKDVAARAGVSIKTVSRVVNHEPTVHPDLVERVRVAAEELHYLPNFGASSIRRLDRRSSTIAVLLEDLSNPFSAAIYRAVEKAAAERGVSVLGGSFDEDYDRERDLITQMTRHRVDGIIIAPATRQHDYLRDEHLADAPFVFVDRPSNGFDADCVMSDSRAAAEVAVAHLLSQGHRAIAFLGDLVSIYTAEERLGGYLAAMTAAGLTPLPEHVAPNLRSVELAERVAGEMLDGPRPPTAFFSGENLLTMGTVRAIRARGLQHRVALVGLDDFLLADLLEPAVTVLAQDVEAIADHAARLLFVRIDGEDFPTTVTTLPMHLITRGSGEIPLISG